MYGEEGRCILDFGGKCERKRPLDRLRHRQMDNIKMYVKERGWKIVHWIYLAQNRYSTNGTLLFVWNCYIQAL